MIHSVRQYNKQKLRFLRLLKLLYLFFFPTFITAKDEVIFENRIIGGVSSNASLYPYFVSIQAMYIDDNKRQQIISCGGTLIAGNVIMTAAQCLDTGNNDKYFVSMINVLFHHNVDYYQASGWEYHADYTVEPKNVRNDIALIYLKESAPFDIQPIKLIFDGRPDPSDTDSTLKIMGFGATENDYNDDGKLKEVSFPGILSHRNCRNLFGGMINTNLQFCTGSTTQKAACGGDSGGPAILQNRNQNFQIGIISFGAPECSRGVTTYTRISGYENWIKNRVCTRNDIPTFPEWCEKE